MRSTIRMLMIGALAGSMVACGGGGSGSASGGITAPTVTLTPQSVKTFSFTWADVSGETEYRLLENPDGMSGYTRIASIGADATSQEIEVFLPARINASYILQACNDSGCVDSSTVFVSGTLAQAVGYVKASNTGAGDVFGFSVALAGDGNTLAVGAPFEDSNATGIGGDEGNDSANASGAVYVFTRTGGLWSQQAYVKASNTGADDEFGYSVALAGDGNTLAVGAYLERSDATGIDGDEGNDLAIASGAVYVFTRSGGVWTQQAYVKASNTGVSDGFGQSVALAGDGNTLAVGADREGSDATGIDGDQGNNSAINSGAVYVFTRSGGVWTEQAYVKASNTGEDDEFGLSVALAGDGNTLAVGAPLEDSNATGIDGDEGNDLANASGVVYVFTRTGGVWSQQAYVKASNTGEFDFFGNSVALAGDGNTLAVGALKEDSNATGIDGDQSNNLASDSGAVYVFTRSGGVWAQQAYVKANNTGAGDRFGWSVALAGDGDTLAVGADDEGSDATGIDDDQGNNSALSSGAVYVFTRSGGVWTQQAYVKASNTGSSDDFGRSVALAGNVNTLAVGAHREGSDATGINGDEGNDSAFGSGAVYLY